MQYYERTCPGLLKIIRDNYWHRACGTQQKLVVVRTLINRSDVTPWKTWDRAVRVKLGNMAVELHYRGFWVVLRGHEARRTQDSQLCHRYS